MPMQVLTPMQVLKLALVHLRCLIARAWAGQPQEHCCAKRPLLVCVALVAGWGQVLPQVLVLAWAWMMGDFFGVWLFLELRLPVPLETPFGAALGLFSVVAYAALRRVPLAGAHALMVAVLCVAYVLWGALRDVRNEHVNSGVRLAQELRTTQEPRVMKTV
jgi:hypothetical protein